MNTIIKYCIGFAFIIMYFPVKCESNENPKFKQFASYSRRKFEDAEGFFPNAIHDNDKNNLVDQLFDNVGHIFGDGTGPKAYYKRTSEKTMSSVTLQNMTVQSTTAVSSTKTDVLSTMTVFNSTTELQTSVCIKSHPENISFTEDEMKYENLTLISDSLHESTPRARYATVLRNNRNIKSLGRGTKVEMKILDKNGLLKENKLSCITCDNVNTENCNDPNNKLISSKICDSFDDVCYSMHTPFGIVDRGCYNMEDSLSIFVCACNLCNYLPISEMPFVIPDKKSWTDNIKKMSHALRLRKTIFSSLDCLKCEVKRDLSNLHTSVENSYCLEGIIPHLVKVTCSVGEICGVKAIRSKGYFWRGCLSAPLYNYWWNFCDSDLCNVDPLVSM